MVACPVHRGDQRHVYLAVCIAGRPLASHRRIQGRSQCTTLWLHNAQVYLILKMYEQPFLVFLITWYLKWFRKEWKYMTWIEAAIPCIIPTPNRYNTLAQTIVYVNNNATTPVISMTSKWKPKHKKEPYCERAWMDRNCFEICEAAHGHNFTCARALSWVFNCDNIKANQNDFFSKIWQYFISVYKKRPTISTKNGGVFTGDGI